MQYIIQVLLKSIYIKKIYYYTESKLLEKYERSIAAHVIVAALSEDDARFYEYQFQAEAYFVPVFIPYTKVLTDMQSGIYCLYHANLSVSENEEVFNMT